MTEVPHPGPSGRSSRADDGAKHMLVPGQPFGYGVNDDDMPITDNLVMSIISIVFCPLLGPIATYYAMKSRQHLREVNRHQANQALLLSRRFSFSGMVIGIIFVILFVAVVIFKLPQQ